MAAMLLGGFKRREVVQFRDETWISAMFQRVLSDLHVAFDQASHQRCSKDLWMLVVWVYFFGDVMFYQSKVAIYGCLVQAFPVSC